MHQHIGLGFLAMLIGTFNSLYLGFFHASYVSPEPSHGSWGSFQFPLLGIFPCIYSISEDSDYLNINFQFPLLGIFPCIIPAPQPSTPQGTTFNSLYLGFFHASDAFFGFVCQLRLFLYDLRYVFSIIIET